MNLEIMKLKRFMLSLTSFDHQRLIFHAERQTVRKAEMARLALHIWLNQHDLELEKWKAKKASELGISVSELEQQLLATAECQAIIAKKKDKHDSEIKPVDPHSCTKLNPVKNQLKT
ncbi:hypothetical protein [Anabaena sp. UHCC 0399]|uniref:hypothetical protein n=1 Tax=Anabaena sp. UHCC 0399 TaxID=3110238 RepID=UPI003A4C6253